MRITDISLNEANQPRIRGYKHFLAAFNAAKDYPDYKIVKVDNEYKIVPRTDSRPEIIPDVQNIENLKKASKDYENALKDPDLNAPVGSREQQEAKKRLDSIRSTFTAAKISHIHNDEPPAKLFLPLARSNDLSCDQLLDLILKGIMAETTSVSDISKVKYRVMQNLTKDINYYK